MAITRVQSKTGTTASGTTVTVEFDSEITVGNHIVLIASADVAYPDIPTGSVGTGDSLNNQYHLDFTTYFAGAADTKLVSMYSAKVEIGGTCSVTFGVDVSGAVSLEAQEWSGLYAGIPYGGGPGAGYITYGQGIGNATPPPLTLPFGTLLANYYGSTLPVVAIEAGLTTSLHTSYEIFPSADRSVTINFPTVTPGDIGVFIVVVYVGPATPVVPDCGSPSVGTVGRRYAHTFSATGGTSPYTYTLSTGSLPTGLSLSTGGTVGGTPTEEGDFAFVLDVTDAHGLHSTLSCSITIEALPPQAAFLELWCWRELTSFESLSQDLVFPPGYQKALLYALALEFFAEYPAAARKYDYDELLAEAEDALKDLEVLNASDAIAIEPPI